jgi:twitching motility protein PilT
MSFFQKFTRKLTMQEEPASPPADSVVSFAEETTESVESPPEPEPEPEPPAPRLEITLEDGYRLEDLLRRLVSEKGSDLHLSVGIPPLFRIHGSLVASKARPLSQEHAEAILFPLVNAEQIDSLKDCGNLDFAYEVPGLARFRVNYFKQSRGLAAVFREIPSKIPTIEGLNMPPVLKNISMFQSGLVVVTGPTGSGKSTTLAAMINHINHNRRAHVITIEDPIEFYHPSRNCLIDHREVGQHALSFSDALRATLREDPDIILVGEMRDLETIYNAIKAAETGALVFGTLHTSSAAKTIDRIIDVFPARQQEQVRAMLAESFRAVVAQLLLEKAGGQGRVAVHEILIAEAGFSNLIREGKTSQINNYIQTGKEYGMQTMDAGLLNLFKAGSITKKTVRAWCHDRNFFRSAGIALD